MPYTPGGAGIFDAYVDYAQERGLRLLRRIDFAFVDAPANLPTTGATTAGVGWMFRVRVNYNCRDRAVALMHELRHVDYRYRGGNEYDREEQERRAEDFAQETVGLSPRPPALAMANGHR